MAFAKQTFLRFEAPGGSVRSAEWRQRIREEVEGAGIEPGQIAVFKSSTALNVVSRTTQASQMLADGAIEVMRLVADAAEKMLSVTMKDLTPAATSTGYRWLYEVPRWVVAHKGDWSCWSNPELAQPQLEAMKLRMERDLSAQLQAWLADQPPLNLCIETPGRPMFLRDAIHNGPKPSPAMARLDVRFSSSKRLEGALFVGALQSLGYGRIYRDGYLETDAKDAKDE